MTTPTITEARMDVGKAIRGELEAIRRLTESGATNELTRTNLTKAVDRLALLRTQVEEAREALADLGPTVIKTALLAGLDQGSLVGKPYGETTVRRLAREAGLPRRPYGPRPRRKDTRPAK